jgi:NADH-quinone oxidoreductase subunit J
MLAVMVVFGILTILSACGVVFSRKPLHSALSLVLTLFFVAVHFALLNAQFVAAIQIMVYAGAIMVLVIFVIMLLGLEAEAAEPRSPFASALAAILTGALVAVMVVVAQDGTVLPVKGVNGVLPQVNGSTEAVGETLFTKNVFAFEVTSMLILAGIIGAVVLGLDAKRPLKKGRGLRAKQVEAGQ